MKLASLSQSAAKPARLRERVGYVPMEHCGKVHVARPRTHSVMVVRCPWGDVELKPWAPK
jgi:hypothetical protein